MMLEPEGTDKPEAATSRIVIVDDHSLVRRGLAELLALEPGLELLGEAADPAGAMQLLEEQRPDLVIVDISLGSGNGLELIKQIRAKSPEIRMLVLSMHDETLYAERVLAAGAMGYVSKHESTETIVHAIHHVLAGRIYLSERMADRVVQRLAPRPGEVSAPPLSVLSDRELEVLGLLGQGMGSRQIARKLRLSIKTIDTYREHLKAKLKLKNATELVRYAVTWTLGES